MGNESFQILGRFPAGVPVTPAIPSREGHFLFNGLSMMSPRTIARVMTEEEKQKRDLADRKFYPAQQEAQFEKKGLEKHTPQTEHPSYKLAFQDKDFLLREELRPVRFQLELLKPEMILDEAGVGSTLVLKLTHETLKCFELCRIKRISKR